MPKKERPSEGKSMGQQVKEVRALRGRLDLFEVVDGITLALWSDATVSAEAHFFAADQWGGYHLLLGLIATTLSAAVGASIFSENEILAVVAGVISLVLVVVTSLSTFLNPEKRSASHYTAGTSFRVVANKAEHLTSIDLKLREKDAKELADELRRLTDERDELTKNSPRVPHRHRMHATKDWEEKQARWKEEWEARAEEIIAHPAETQAVRQGMQKQESQENM